MSIIKASVTEVQIGLLTIQGLMSENGEFAVAVPQVSEHFQFAKGQASRNLKVLLGDGFQFAKWKTSLNPKAVNVIMLPDVERMILELALKGNEAAIAFARDLIGLSLHQLFCDAFDQKFEKEDRQQWFEYRQYTKIDFRDLTAELKKHGFSERWEFGRFVGALQTKLGIENGTRDQLDTKTLIKLQSVQVKLITFMECGVTPWEALKRI